MRFALKQELRRRWIALRRDDRGVAAVEFAAVGVPFFMTIVGIMVIALLTFSASSLDYAVQKASRQIMVGQTQTSNLTADQFQQTILCPLLPAGLFDCSKLVVSLTSFASASFQVNGTYADHYYEYLKADQSGLKVPTTPSFCLGAGGSYQVLQVTYPFPILFSFLSGSPQMVDGKYILMSSLTFKNEPFAAASSAGC